MPGTEAFSLAGRVAIVTGGNRGIGRAIAFGLARAGAAIMIAARDAAMADEALGSMWAAGADAAFTATDVSEPSECAALAAATLQRFGRVDILVNNAGIMRAARPEEMSFSDWQSVVATNLSGAFLCAQAVYPVMRKQGGGKIINLGSLAATFGSAHGAAYGASKGGIVQLTKSLAVAWGRDSIQVNAILPGYIESDQTRTAEVERPGSFAAKLARTPAGRIGQPEDIAGAAVFLAGAAADFITGAAIPVDGGYAVQI